MRGLGFLVQGAPCNQGPDKWNKMKMLKITFYFSFWKYCKYNMYKNANISWEKLSSVDASCAYEILLMQAGFRSTHLQDGTCFKVVKPQQKHIWLW